MRTQLLMPAREHTFRAICETEATKLVNKYPTMPIEFAMLNASKIWLSDKDWNACEIIRKRLEEGREGRAPRIGDVVRVIPEQGLPFLCHVEGPDMGMWKKSMSLCNGVGVPFARVSDKGNVWMEQSGGPWCAVNAGDLVSTSETYRRTFWTWTRYMGADMGVRFSATMRIWTIQTNPFA